MESRPLVVVGAGVAGTAAAIEAARAGVHVTLVDENPVGISTMGLDVPQFFGQRIDGALNNRAAMLERVIAANKDMTAAAAAGSRCPDRHLRVGGVSQFRKQQGTRRPATRTGRRQAVVDGQIRPSHRGSRGA